MKFKKILLLFKQLKITKFISMNTYNKILQQKIFKIIQKSNSFLLNKYLILIFNIFQI